MEKDIEKCLMERQVDNHVKNQVGIWHYGGQKD